MAPTPTPREAKRRAQQATTALAWRSKKNKTIELPSGNLAVLRRPGMEKFLSAGYLPDTLRSVLQEQISSASNKPVKVTDITEQDIGLEEAAEWMGAMDRVAVQVFVEPKLAWHMKPATGPDGKPLMKDGKPVHVDIPEEDRDPEVLYTDDLDLEDKQFAFQYAVGGDADLTRFRAAAASLVDGVSAGADVALPPERGAVPGGS